MSKPFETGLKEGGMTGTQITMITVVGIIGLFMILVWPNLPVSKPYIDPCAKIDAHYLGHGLCGKRDGSVWQVPEARAQEG